MPHYIDGLVQERRNSIANALELCLSCTHLWTCSLTVTSADRIRLETHKSHCIVLPWFITWLRHQMEHIFHITGPLCGEFPTQRPVLFFLSVPWIKGWVNNYEAGDLRCHHAHYDIIVMSILDKKDDTCYKEVWLYITCISALGLGHVAPSAVRATGSGVYRPRCVKNLPFWIQRAQYEHLFSRVVFQETCF